MAAPKLIVLAGPNGAGKSSYAEAKDLDILAELRISSFDYDLELRKLCNEYASILNEQIEQNLETHTKEIFEKRAKQALKDKSHFSFQTNFDREYTDMWRQQFHDQGFETHLYFLYLPNTNICMQRVKKRVSEGGHNVSPKDVKRRFTSGLRCFDRYFQSYHTIKFIDTSEECNVLLLEAFDDRLISVSPRFPAILSKHQMQNALDWLKSRIVDIM